MMTKKLKKMVRKACTFRSEISFFIYFSEILYDPPFILMWVYLLFTESGKEKEEPQIIVNKEKETRDDKMAESSGVSCPPSSNLPCLDKLRDELSCAVRPL